MNIFTKQPSFADMNDANLVLNSLGGNREAFCQIVTRYQNLLCSLAYSSVGDIKNSEDIAQDTFVEAWKKLDSLHEPQKLKSWLCGILRFKVSHYFRHDKNQPIKQAEEIEHYADVISDDTDSEQVMIQQQEHALLWNVLDEIDITYREPLILFYREQQSIERVASELDLTKDTVKQRLSRGRKLLKSALSSLVEEGLKNSKPGTAFTTAVMAGISGISPPTKAAVLGASAAKTGSFFSFATLLAFLASSSGLISMFFGLRASLDQSRTERERTLVKKSVMLFLTFAVLYVLGMFGVRQLALSNLSYAGIFSVVSQAIVLIFVFSYLFLIAKMFSAMQELRAKERIFEPEAFSREIDQENSKKREYISPVSIFGIPLIHIQFGMTEKNDKPALGWIAGGSYAHGLLLAWGGVAIAPISIGILSVGIVSLGAVGIGIFSTGTVAIGVIAFGSSAIGYKAYAALSSLGWESAFSNGFSIAKEAAIAPIAYAKQINNEQAAEIMNLTMLDQTYQWVLAAIAFFVIVPSIWHSNKVRKLMGN